MMRKTCAITGHRDLSLNFDKNALYEELEKLIRDGCDRFLCGMAEGFDLTACDDCNGKGYVLYQAKYPWQITDADKPLTEEKLTDIFNHYVGILTDEAIPVEDQSVENGG